MIEYIAFDPAQSFLNAVNEFQHAWSPEWWRANFDALIKVFIIDITLAGDNAIVVGMAASQVAPSQRSRVIFWGIAAAVILRILFAGVTQQLLAIVGLTLAGGFLLMWVCWKMYRQIIDGAHEASPSAVGAGVASDTQKAYQVGFGMAVWQIIVADVSMSLDNVLAVAGAAGESKLVLVIGLTLAIVLMAVASHFIAGLLAKHPWISWVGLIIIVWVAFDMIYRGSHEVTCQAFQLGCSEDLYQAVLHRLGL
ncbi:MAG: TerC family protein [Alphaproteobacteria bacterium]|nr:TerC family protein [Alphaproteobacteria bacterium]